jgi:hypothetical protein
LREFVIWKVPLAWLITAVGSAWTLEEAAIANAETATIAARVIHRESGRESITRLRDISAVPSRN